MALLEAIYSRFNRWSGRFPLLFFYRLQFRIMQHNQQSIYERGLGRITGLFSCEQSLQQGQMLKESQWSKTTMGIWPFMLYYFHLGLMVTITRLYLDNDGVPLSVTFKIK